MHHPERWTFDWFYKRHDMDKADNRLYRQTETERRAEQLHECCRMPAAAAAITDQDSTEAGIAWSRAGGLRHAMDEAIEAMRKAHRDAADITDPDGLRAEA